MSAKFVFITGGVVSSLGKGVAAASLGALLQARGFKIRLLKLDPYINVDPGTMSPQQHGEVFVTEDGTETDLDLGHYERFTGIETGALNSTTTGKIYCKVIAKERRGEYLGATVQVIPHVTDEIKNFILQETQDLDFVICEIGGTVGDIESLPYLEAIRQLSNILGRNRTLFIHLTLLPYIHVAGEIKTKPTQHSVKTLLNVGIQADILLCRSEIEISQNDKNKLALFCNVDPQDVIIGADAPSIYHVPIAYHKSGLDIRVCEYFGISPDIPIDLRDWYDIVHKIENPISSVKIAIVGKYVKLKDSYKSIIEAVTHAAISKQISIDLLWVDVDKPESLENLKESDGIIVAGGFGVRGIESKIEAIRFVRENKIPGLCICLGMQLAVIEACRNVLGIKDAGSTEFGECSEPAVCLLEEWQDRNSIIQKRKGGDDLGATMRLGAYECILLPETKAHDAYGTEKIYERHRHRYEINLKYKESLEKAGLLFSGMSPDGKLTEIVEWRDHPWLVGVQFHPEFKSFPFKPHPLFLSFIEAVASKSQKSA
jgi:CTP synthase